MLEVIVARLQDDCSVDRALAAKARLPGSIPGSTAFFHPMLFQRSTDGKDADYVWFSRISIRSSDVAPSIGPGCDYAFLLDL